MILSFHPVFEGDVNIICAGRDPDSNDLTAIKEARAVILPQGCRKSLYIMAAENCPHVFPDYRARFDFPGKTGQLELFKKTGVPYPKTQSFRDILSFKHQYPDTSSLSETVPFPLVFKFDWGGEGDAVFLIQSASELEDMLLKTERLEASGQSGFMIQEYINTLPEILRVAVIGGTYISYWRINKDPDIFKANLAHNGIIDEEKHPDIQLKAVSMAKDFCKKTGINLAGFDFIRNTGPSKPGLLFLEINYFFGRKGLGGSLRYYDLLTDEIRKWIVNLPDG
jgi:ribosomal protein S6--L-glutamate ligase